MFVQLERFICPSRDGCDDGAHVQHRAISTRAAIKLRLSMSSVEGAEDLSTPKKARRSILASITISARDVRELDKAARRRGSKPDNAQR
jgi:hypothetical protein